MSAGHAPTHSNDKRGERLETDISRQEPIAGMVPTSLDDLSEDRGRGILRGRAGDWLVQYARSDLSVVSARVFEQTYELLD